MSGPARIITKHTKQIFERTQILGSQYLIAMQMVLWRNVDIVPEGMWGCCYSKDKMNSIVWNGEVFIIERSELKTCFFVIILAVILRNSAMSRPHSTSIEVLPNATIQG